MYVNKLICSPVIALFYGGINSIQFNTCIHAYMHTCIHAYMHTCIHAYMHAFGGYIYTQSQEVFGGLYKVSDGCTMVAVNLA